MRTGTYRYPTHPNRKLAKNIPCTESVHLSMSLGSRPDNLPTFSDWFEHNFTVFDEEKSHLSHTLCFEIFS